MKNSREEQHAAASEYYKKSVESFIKSMQDMGANIPGGISSWEEVFRQWHNLVKLATVNPEALQRSLEEFSLLCKVWRKGSLRLFDEWNNCLMKLVEASRNAGKEEDGTQHVMKACLISYEEFFDKLRRARFSFATEQMKAYFGYIRSFLPVDMEANGTQENGDKKTGGSGS